MEYITMEAVHLESSMSKLKLFLQDGFVSLETVTLK